MVRPQGKLSRSARPPAPGPVTKFQASCTTSVPTELETRLTRPLGSQAAMHPTTGNVLTLPDCTKCDWVCTDRKLQGLRLR